ncbi:MAG TPA: CGNR zinc finger domain-containing protein [Agromyces sp.]|jgi:predicted RNA-binding Zn ribbon-like protein|nr:CGNR zinc finger domain-containing protein [Agromyces sp.]
MIFTDDTVAALGFMSAVADTVPGASESGEDELATTAQLGALLDAWGFSGRRDGDRRELDEVRAIRDRLREIWTLERDEMADVVNAILEETNATPKLMRHDDLDWHIHAVSQESPLAERMLVEAAMALVDVIRADETRRLAQCDADDCTGVFVDLSKNASKRYCSVRCGNRMAARAHRARAGDAPAA